jgi:hypothetical protein
MVVKIVDPDVVIEIGFARHAKPGFGLLDRMSASGHLTIFSHARLGSAHVIGSERQFRSHSMTSFAPTAHVDEAPILRL